MWVEEGGSLGGGVGLLVRSIGPASSVERVGKFEESGEGSSSSSTQPLFCSITSIAVVRFRRIAGLWVCGEGVFAARFCRVVIGLEDGEEGRGVCAAIRGIAVVRCGVEGGRGALCILALGLGNEELVIGVVRRTGLKVASRGPACVYALGCVDTVEVPLCPCILALCVRIPWSPLQAVAQVGHGVSPIGCSCNAVYLARGCFLRMWSSISAYLLLQVGHTGFDISEEEGDSFEK